MRLRFDQIFFLVMSLSFLCAFVIPARIASLERIQIQGIYLPVSWPVYKISNWIRGRSGPTVAQDNRAADDVLRENEGLRQQVTELQAQIVQLQALAGERQNLGDRQSLCNRFSVAGSDAGSH